ncbi:cell division protein FtsQ [Ferrimonas sediminum]|uniref:Cell division protein FtsQ n=1 Tax=Ferrimonas sediminum TaxID=718193 RepID=A0A1G8KFU9_9GAMM|nr:cell division protein FtsQ [Ferrimonas sediminum]
MVSLPALPKWRWPVVNWYSLMGVLLLVLVLVLLAWGGNRLGQTLADADRLPISEIALVGERQFTSDAEVQQALTEIDGASLVTANMQGVAAALTELPWVKRVTVRREWPNRLRVYLVEQQPRAHWNGDHWLNQDADAFSAPARPGLVPLPELWGPVNSNPKVWQHWLIFSQLLRLNGFEPAALELTARHAWKVQLKDGLELRLGRTDGVERLQRFIDLWPTLKTQGRRAQYIDLRYDTGLAVGWQLEQQENQ